MKRLLEREDRELRKKRKIPFDKFYPPVNAAEFIMQALTDENSETRFRFWIRAFSEQQTMDIFQTLENIPGTEKHFCKAKIESFMGALLLFTTHENQKNNEKMLEHLRTAEALGDPEAIANLAWCHLKGIAFEKNIDTAINILEKLREIHPVGSYVLGAIYMEGKDVPLDYDKAEQFFREGENKSHALSTGALGQLYFLQTKYREALPCLKFAAEQGSIQSAWAAGLCYHMSLGTVEDTRQANKYFKQAYGNAEAQCLTGIYYLYTPAAGQIARDNPYTQKAMAYLEQAANKGNLDAIHTLGWLNLERLDIPDRNAGLAWLQKGIDRGDDKTLLYKADYHWSEKNYTLAKPLYERLVSKGNPVGYLYLGKLYEKGPATSRDIFKALQYYHKSRLHKITFTYNLSIPSEPLVLLNFMRDSLENTNLTPSDARLARHLKKAGCYNMLHNISGTRGKAHQENPVSETQAGGIWNAFCDYMKKQYKPVNAGKNHADSEQYFIWSLMATKKNRYLGNLFKSSPIQIPESIKTKVEEAMKGYKGEDKRKEILNMERDVSKELSFQRWKYFSLFEIPKDVRDHILTDMLDPHLMPVLD